MTASSTAPLTVPDLLNFYQEQVAYYRRYARRHCVCYWFFLWLLIANGIAIALCLFVQAPTTYVAGASLALNAILLAAKYVAPEAKWARYRMTEIRLKFAVQKMWTKVAREQASGKTQDIAILEALTDLHPEVESLVTREYGDFFSQLKVLQDMDEQLINKT